MTDQPVQLTITPLYSPPQELDLPFSTYVVSGGPRLVVVDPGPAWHIRKHMNTIASLATQETQIVVLVQTPGPHAFGGLHLLADLSSKRNLILHWKAASGAGDALDGWRVQTLTTRSAGLPISPTAKLSIGISSYAGAPGSLMSFERSTGTLFSGPFFGSLGPGQDTGQPILRRESVRAYRDAITPTMPAHVAETVFGSDIAINQIAPSHGRLAVGGTALIQTLFADGDSGPALPAALYRLFVRAAALMGADAASGIYRASGVPIPEMDTGYRSLRDGGVGGLTDDHWTKTLDAIEQWVPGPALISIFPLAAELAEYHHLSITDSVRKFARAARWPGTAASPSSAPSARRSNGAPERAIGTADMPGTLAPGTVEPGTPMSGADAGTETLTDSLTGLMNETVFKQRLAGQFKNDQETEGHGAVMVVGVDNIQRINTTYGRTGGDEALYTVAYLLRNFQSAHSRRGAHRLYKLTGPQFAYVISNGSVAEGAQIAERIRRSVAESAMFLEQLTVSIGVVGLEEVIESSKREEGDAALVDEVTNRGFARIRMARQGGANTVCATDPTAASVVSAGSTVLVADPDAPYLEMLTKQLEEQGYTVLLARDGAEAVRIIDQIIPDAIVAEIMLPKQNGFALREELRHSSSLSKIPFILVSHRKTDETMEKASMLGIVHFLAKPFSLVELIGLLRNLTRGDVGAATATGGRG